MEAVKISIDSHIPEVLAALNANVERALETCGLLAEGYAQVNITNQKAVDTGNLRNSITHKVVNNEKEHSVYIGTNVEYAPYVEFGTGVYYSGGRRTPWSYQDKDGNWHRTSGMKARPYLRPAISDHAETYEQVIKDELGK